MVGELVNIGNHLSSFFPQRDEGLLLGGQSRIVPSGVLGRLIKVCLSYQWIWSRILGLLLISFDNIRMKLFGRLLITEQPLQVHQKETIWALWNAYYQVWRLLSVRLPRTVCNALTGWHPLLTAPGRPESLIGSLISRRWLVLRLVISRVTEPTDCQVVSACPRPYLRRRQTRFENSHWQLSSVKVSPL